MINKPSVHECTAYVVHCRRPKAEHVVDFENLAELPAGAFKLAKHKDISLKATSAVNTLLPADHHYKVCHILTASFAASGWARVCSNSKSR